MSHNKNLKRYALSQLRKLRFALAYCALLTSGKNCPAAFGVGITVVTSHFFNPGKLQFKINFAVTCWK